MNPEYPVPALSEIGKSLPQSTSRQDFAEKKPCHHSLLSSGIYPDMRTVPSLTLLIAFLAGSCAFAAPKDKVNPQGKAVGHQDLTTESSTTSSSEPVAAPAGDPPADGTTAYTDPMGGMVVNCPNNSDTILTIPFHRSEVYTGQISSVSASDITMVGNPGFTVDEFVTTGGHYALISSGALEGLVLPILSNTVDTLTVDSGGEDLSSLAVSDTLSIVPFWTLETLVGTDSPNGLQILTYDLDFAGINLGASSVYTHYTTYGWYLGGTPSGDVIIYPGEAFILRNSSGSDFPLIFSGNVQAVTHKTYFRTLDANVIQDNHIGLTTPVDVALSDANIGYAGDQLLIFDNTLGGTNKSASDVITYYDTFGWYRGATKVDDPSDPANLLYLKAGQGYVYRKNSSSTPSTFDWTFTPGYLPF